MIAGLFCCLIKKSLLRCVFSMLYFNTNYIPGTFFSSFLFFHVCFNLIPPPPPQTTKNLTPQNRGQKQNDVPLFFQGPRAFFLSFLLLGVSPLPTISTTQLSLALLTGVASPPFMYETSNRFTSILRSCSRSLGSSLARRIPTPSSTSRTRQSFSFLRASFLSWSRRGEVDTPRGRERLPLPRQWRQLREAKRAFHPWLRGTSGGAWCTESSMSLS